MTGKKDISYEDAMRKIQALLRKFETNTEKADIDNLLNDVEEAASLITLCKKKLFETEAKINEVLDNLGNDASC